MALADDEINLTFDGERLTLRPTLRAAMRLERAFGGFDKILAAVADQNVTMMAALIEECGGASSSLLDFLNNDRRQPMAYKLGALVEPLMALLMALAGVEPSELDTPDADGARISYAEHHAQLFKIATGWLGWSPADAWNATPSEIKAAYAGRVELLQAVFGSTEGKPAPMSEDALAAFLRARAA